MTPEAVGEASWALTEGTSADRRGRRTAAVAKADIWRDGRFKEASPSRQVDEVERRNDAKGARRSGEEGRCERWAREGRGGRERKQQSVRTMRGDRLRRGESFPRAVLLRNSEEGKED